MKIFRSAFLVLIASLLGTVAAKADTLTYNLSGPYGFQVQFTLPQDPTFTSESSGYVVPVTGLTVYSTPVTSIEFFNTAHGGGIGADGFQLTGSQLYTFTGNTLVLSSGTFTLEDRCAYSLVVTDNKTTPTPEPSTLLLLAAGLAGLAFVSRRNPVDRLAL